MSDGQAPAAPGRGTWPPASGPDAPEPEAEAEPEPEAEAEAPSGEQPVVQGGYPRPSKRMKRIWHGEEPTQPMPLVESLARTPYRNPRRMKAPREDAQARASLDLAVRAGELLLRCGAGTRDVESSVVAVAAASGLDRLEVDITNQSMLIQCLSPTGQTLTVLRVVRSSSRDFARLVAVHQFVEDLVAGRVDRAQAKLRLRAIAKSQRFWPRWAISLGFGVLAAAVTMLLGAVPTAIAFSVVSAVVVDRVGRFLFRHGLPEFYLSAIGACIATIFAWGAYALGHAGVVDVGSADFAFIVAGGIVVLLPGRAMASAVEDAVTGYPVTAAGRLFGVLLTASGIIAGVAVALSVTLRFDTIFDMGLATPTTVEITGRDAPLLVRVAGVALGAAASAVTLRTRRHLVLPSAALGAVALLSSDFVHRVAGLGELTALAAACTVAGFCGRLLALRLGAPALVLVVPAVAPLLPGLAIFRGMYALVSGSVFGAGVGPTMAGVTTLLGASAAALALATGSVLGDVMAAPFDRPIIKQRRSRRR